MMPAVPTITEDTPEGTPVLVVLDDRSLVMTFTRSAPWQLRHGELVVMLRGRTGGYLASRVHPYPQPPTEARK